MSVSERDRDFMRRIGEHKAASHDAAAVEHRSQSVAERLERSWTLYIETRSSARPTDADDPTPFYDRARARGLYRP
jgi:hypothetical protein